MSDFLPRISTLQSTLARQRMALQVTQEMATAEKEAATGLRADVFRQLGARAATSVSLRNQIDRSEAFVSSNRLLEGRLDATNLALSEIRDAGGEFLSLAIGNRDSPTATASEVQNAARAALNRIIATTNLRYQGKAVFSGVEDSENALTTWKGTSPTGQSPEEVFAQIVGDGPRTVAEAETIIADIDSVFDNSHADPNRHFEGMFYRGASATLSDGTPNERVAARIDDGATLDHGVQANDTAFTELLRGLAMLASTDISEIDDPDAYKIFVGSALDGVSRGLTEVLSTQTRLGSQQKLLDRTITGQEDLVHVYESRVLDLEGVDPYEAATRLTQLQTQLQSSYALSARLANLSLLDFIR